MNLERNPHPRLQLARVCIFAALALLPATLTAAAGVEPSHMRAYTRSEAMVPMRDGVRLHCVIFRPDAPHPANSCPSCSTARPTAPARLDAADLNDEMPELYASGYLFVMEDVRGRYGSEGTFVMNRPALVGAHNHRTISTRPPTPTTPSTGW